MAKESFRFIHASDFHLERPMQDIFDLPDHLKPQLVEAPWKAAEAIFEHALVENVDFVVLAGDLLNPVTCGAQGIAFLVDHFELLNERGIQVYWATAIADDFDRWPEAVSLPTNVRVFSSRGVEKFVYRRHDSPLASLLGRSVDGNDTVRPAEYASEPDDNFVIAVGHGSADAETLAAERVDYWALGGKHQAEILQTESPCIRYCGSPQARSLQEPGPHGFNLVDVDAQGGVQVHAIEIDSVRYTEQEISADDLALGRDIRQLLSKRIARLQSEANGRNLLVHWRVHMDLENAATVGPSAVEDLLGWLRREFGHGQPSVWSTELSILPPKDVPEKWKEEDTILGDFLRTAAKHRKESAKNLQLKPLIDAETPATSVWQTTLAANDSRSMVATLDKSTLLGVDLLRGHQVDLLASTRRFGGSEK